MTALQLLDLNKSYGSLVALDSVNLEIKEGEVAALLGPNGSGKTTVVKCISSLVEPDSGEIRVEGKNIRDDRRYLANVGAVLEGTRNIHWRLTVLQNAFYFSGIRAPIVAKVYQRVEHLLELLGLAKFRNTIVAKLSTGNRQKVSVLCALAHCPSIIVMDEPTLGLDIATVKSLCDFIAMEAKEDGRAFLVTSHDLKFIDSICDRVFIIHDGKLRFSGSVQELKSKLQQYEAVFEFNGSAPHELIRLLNSELTGLGEFLAPEADRIIARFDDVGVALQLAGLILPYREKLINFTTGRISMEKAYLEVLENKHETF